MKEIRKEIIKTAVLGCLIPAILLFGVVAATARQEPAEEIPTGIPVTLSPATTSTAWSEDRIFLPVLHGEEIVNMDLEAYLVGVLLSEIPASFSVEALKAQAVAARTYALKTHEQGYKHGGAICTNASCCQGYISIDDYLQEGKGYEIARVSEAVQDTAGQVMVYDGKLILATYFDCSGGHTEDAQVVWGGDYPYLQAVESTGEEFAPYFTDEKTIAAESFLELMGVSLIGAPETWFGEIQISPGGGVATIMIGDVQYKGTTIRSLLGLRSTAFSISVSGDSITFSTSGYGHRVGLSQYGSEAMARQGSSYLQILAHYYHDVSVVMYKIVEGK